MSWFSFFSVGADRHKNYRTGRKSSGHRARLYLEPLEQRALLTATVISGYVYNDANNNGLYDAGETPFANSNLELENAKGVVIGTAVSDANGFYQFSTDSSVSTNPTTLTETATVPNSPTDWTHTLSLPQFDPSLGTLTSIEIDNGGTFMSDIKVESLDAAPSVITATVSGTLTLDGAGFSPLVTNTSYNEVFNATAFDGVLDFGGTSGHDFGWQSAPGTEPVILTSASALALYTGTGNVSFTQNAHATSSASGAGNLVTQISSTASGAVTITYTYIPSNALKPGSYTVIQTSQPAGYFPGKLSSNGTVLPGDVTVRVIPITLTANSSVNNDFAEVAPASLAGYVYVDANDNGQKDAGEPAIPNVTLTLTGTNDLGASVNATTTTAADGSYEFGDLRPGNYTVSESPPSGYLDGATTAGSQGGTVSPHQISAITLTPAAAGVNYDFGHLLPASLAGYVYYDANDNGQKDLGESGIASVTLTLTGTNDLGASVNTTTTTAADGSYHFEKLRPGHYAISETPPSGYLDGQENLGSLGGSLGTHEILGLAIVSGAAGINYDFGHLLPASLAGYVYYDANDNGKFNVGDAGISTVVVTLTGTNDQGNSIQATTTSGSDGSYLFQNLRPGSYTVTETPPSGYLDGKVDVGSAGGTSGIHQVSSVAIVSATTATGYDFGHLLPGSLAGYVYFDGNDDRTFDVGDAGISTVVVTLTGTNDLGTAVQVSTTTAADGSYSFQALRPGTYTLTETAPAGYLDGTVNVGSVGGSLGAHQISAISIGPGTAGTAYNFGHVLPSALAGFVYLDSNDDGIMESNESGIAGVTLTLTGTNDLGTSVSTTQVTGADGSYQFSGLRPGSYTIAITQPSSYLPGKLALGTAGGSVGTNQFAAIPLGTNINGTEYNFGELLPSFSTGQISISYSGPFISNPFPLDVLSKLEFLSTSTGPTVDPTVLADAYYVDAVYRTILDRPADINGLIGWVESLLNGMSQAQMIKSFWNSAEHRILEVDQFYEIYLGRPADAAGQGGWVSALMNGESEANVELAFLTSGEYIAKHPDNFSFVSGLYANVLGRGASSAEINGWVNALVGGMSRTAVAEAFLNSSEANAGIVTEAYNNVLGRAPDAGGLQGWVSSLDNGLSLESLYVAFLSSGEFVARVDSVIPAG